MRQAERARVPLAAALLAVGLLAVGAVPATAAQAPPAAGATDTTGATGVPPSPARWVTDGAGFLSPAVRDTLDARLQQYQAKTGHQVLVWIGRSTGSQPLEDFTVKAFAAWRVGRKGIDDGLVIFLFADDRKIRLEVGYGLEGQIPDAIASRIINEVMLPRLKGGDRDGAVVAGVDAVVAVIAGEPWTAVFRQPAGAPTAGALPPEGAAGQDQAPPEAPRRHPPSIFQKIVFTILGIAFLFFLITHPSFALWLLFSLMSGGRGGGDGGGGGFSGGGGRSGGGGASGSW